MSNIGEYPVMSELKDEDKWFRFFTLKQLFYYGIALFLGIITTVLLYKVGLEIIGIVCIIINLIIAAIHPNVLLPRSLNLVLYQLQQRKLGIIALQFFPQKKREYLLQILRPGIL